MISIDRIEGPRAVLEVDGETVEIPASALPEGALEGDLLLLSRGDATQQLKAAEDRLARLRARDTGGEEIEL